MIVSHLRLNYTGCTIFQMWGIIVVLAQRWLGVLRLHILTTTISFILLGCQNLQQPSFSLVSATPLIYTAQQYDRLAQKYTNTTQSFIYQLLAARAYHHEGQKNVAYQRLQSLAKEKLPTNIRAQQQIVYAQLLVNDQRIKEAIDQLTMAPEDIPLSVKRHWHQEKMQLHDMLGQKILAAREAIWLEPFLETAQQKQSADQIWQHLSGLNAFTLRAFESKPPPDPVTGWLELAAIYDSYSHNLSQLEEALQQWQTQFPDHRALSYIHPVDHLDDKIPSHQSKHIAVLLPLSGRFKSQALAIQAGILTAFKQTKTSIAPLDITFYDTQIQKLPDILQQLNENAVDFVIGPLLKKDVEDYLSATPHYPTLLLNQPSELTQKPQTAHYFFSISLAHELEQAAEHMTQMRYHSPLIFSADTPSNRKYIAAFQNRWQQFHDTPAQTVFYQHFNDIEKRVSEGLHTQDSQARIGEIKRLTKLPIYAEPRSRQDIDAIYLLGSPQEVRMLRSFIDIKVNVKPEPPKIFASSKAHDLFAQTQDDLKQISITEMPWLISKAAPVFTKIQTLWPTFDTWQWRLFAMGYDALNLNTHLLQLSKIPTYRYQGLTGHLQMTANHVIYRKLVWGTYKRSGIFTYAQHPVTP